MILGVFSTILNFQIYASLQVIESANKKNAVKSSPPPNKDINLQISKINNDFATEKYLGKTYWETLEFLKKK